MEKVSYRADVQLSQQRKKEKKYEEKPETFQNEVYFIKELLIRSA